MRKKRFLAVIIAASMMLGNSVTAFATVSSQDVTKSPVKGTATGKAFFEGYVNEDVFIVEVPTVATPTDQTFDFIMDPQRLIEKTSGNKYAISNTNDANRHGISTDSISYGSLYFVNRNDDGTVSQLSTSSNYLHVKNKGSRDVTVGLKAEVKNMGTLEFSADEDVSGNDKPSIYLAMQGADTSGNNAQTDVIESISQGASMSATVSGCDGDYIVSVNSANEYEYVVSSDSVSYSGYDFRLTGACGGGGFTDWKAVEKAMGTAVPKVAVTWEIVPYVTPVAPGLIGTTNSFARPANGGVIVSVNMGAGTLGATGIEKITFPDPANASNPPKTLAESNYSVYEENGVWKIKLLATHLANLTANRVYTIQFNDAAKTTITFTVTV